MQEVLAVGLAAMQQDMSRMDRVASNLANISTPGYKREVVAIRPFLDAIGEVATARGVEPEAHDARTASVAAQFSVMFDMRPGTVKNTGEALDVALTGEGFFEISTEEGLAYTRQGNFKTDARGRLVTAQGQAVMGKAGEIYLTTPSPVIDQAGQLTEPDATSISPGTTLAQLKVVRFDDPQEMRRMGNGLLAAGTGMVVMDAADVRIKQGALENANVDTMHEMVQMIQTMRHFESMQKVIQGYDDMVGTAIHKLGDLS
jgi:flagellar basal-body rod protein FlgG